MRGWPRRIVGSGIAVVVTVAVAGLSRVPWEPDEGREAAIRLSWRMRGEIVEECAERSPEELEELPVHMRNPEACEGRASPYRLRVRLDGRGVVEDTVRPAGARGDRPIYVFRDLRVEPGVHRVSLTFEAVDPGAVSDPLILERSLTLESGEIVLVTYDDEEERLVVKDRP